MMVSRGILATRSASSHECFPKTLAGKPPVPPGRSDNGPEFIAKALRDWLDVSVVDPLYIEPARCPTRLHRGWLRKEAEVGRPSTRPELETLLTFRRITGTA